LTTARLLAQARRSGSYVVSATAGDDVSKGKKILILVGLLILCSSGFTMFQTNGAPQLAAFFALMTVGLLVAIIVVGLSRGESRRR
jgi:hypothetical protein